jgi:hypothetical protein
MRIQTCPQPEVVVLGGAPIVIRLHRFLEYAA